MFVPLVEPELSGSFSWAILHTLPDWMPLLVPADLPLLSQADISQHHARNGSKSKQDLIHSFLQLALSHT